MNLRKEGRLSATTKKHPRTSTYLVNPLKAPSGGQELRFVTEENDIASIP